jgi:hypothetical protein
MQYHSTPLHKPQTCLGITSPWRLLERQRQRTTRVIASLRHTVHELGWVDAGLYYAGRLLKLLSRNRVLLFKYYLVMQRVRDTRLLPQGRGGDITVREIAATEEVIHQFPRPPAVLHYRYRQGAICLGAFKHQECIGFMWVLVGNYQEDEVRTCFVPLPAHQAAWNFDLYINPEHRLGLTFPRLWDATHTWLKNRDIAWVMSRISAFNSGSYTAHVGMGAIRLSWVVYVCIGTWQVMFTRIAPFFHLSVCQETYPELRLHPKTARRRGE